MRGSRPASRGRGTPDLDPDGAVGLQECMDLSVWI